MKGSTVYTVSFYVHSTLHAQICSEGTKQQLLGLSCTKLLLVLPILTHRRLWSDSLTLVSPPQSKHGLLASQQHEVVHKPLLSPHFCFITLKCKKKKKEYQEVFEIVCLLSPIHLSWHDTDDTVAGDTLKHTKKIIMASICATHQMCVTLNCSPTLQMYTFASFFCYVQTACCSKITCYQRKAR